MYLANTHSLSLNPANKTRPTAVCSSINTARVGTRDDNGSAGHGSSGSTNLSGSRVSTRDPLTHDQVNKIRRTGYFVAVMMFDFESTST